jgi:hypothetical protein
MKNILPIPLVENILDDYRDILGKDFLAYKNHVYRVIFFCFERIQNVTPEQKEKIIIAACFHDLGIWTDITLDYLPPSIILAKSYLHKKGLDNYSEEIELMIAFHHKLRKYSKTDHFLVEIFRQGDLIDVSMGIVTFGVSKESINKIRGEFPNAGFHVGLIRPGINWFYRHPLKPVPFLRW